MSSEQALAGADGAFDNDLYIKLQARQILRRRNRIGGRLYLEFGGKLYDDTHAERVLPGFRAESKLAVLQRLGPELEILMVMSARDLEDGRVREDLGLTYPQELIRMLRRGQERGLRLASVVITQMKPEYTHAQAFVECLRGYGIAVAVHRYMEGYPHDDASLLTPEGLGSQDFVELTRSIAVIIAPGSGSGKMSVATAQLYGEYVRGRRAGYAKYELFPFWNRGTDDPINLAYEAATAELDDLLVVDPYFWKRFHTAATATNRDVEGYPLLLKVLQRIDLELGYGSPTELTVNMAPVAVVDGKACARAAQEEIVRRYAAARQVMKMHEDGKRGDAEYLALLVCRIHAIMREAGLLDTPRCADLQVL